MMFDFMREPLKYQGKLLSHFSNLTVQHQGCSSYMVKL